MSSPAKTAMRPGNQDRRQIGTKTIQKRRHGDLGATNTAN